MRGLSLVEVLIGIGVVVVVFMGIITSYKLALDTVLQSKARIGGLSLLSERLEYVRALPYDQVGTVGGIPAGPIAQSATTTLNGILYTIQTLVLYRDDSADGLGGADSTGITADYKDISVDISWTVAGKSRNIRSVMRTAPRGVETLTSGGVLRVNVFNAVAAPVPGATVHIVNSTIVPSVDLYVDTDSTGAVLIPGAPVGSNYKVSVTKDGYSTAQTYDTTTANPNPNPANLSIVNTKTTTISLAIDTTGSLAIKTLSEPVSQAVVSVGTSTSATPSSLYIWNSLLFASTTAPSAPVLARVYSGVGAGATLIPDSVLAGNSAGLSSPINISALSTTTYTSLSVVLEDVASSSLVYTVPPSPMPNIALSVRGSKVIGNTNGGAPIYKYSSSPTTNSSGVWSLSGVEWDTYPISLGDTTYDIVDECQYTTSVPAGGAATTTLMLRPGSTNSLRAYVSSSTMPVAGATVAILGAVNATSTTSLCGQAYFGALTSGLYTVTVSKPGYQNTVDTITVSGDTKSSLVLTQ